MRIALFSDVYKPQVNGVVNHVALLKQHLEQWGNEVYLFVPGPAVHDSDETNVIRLPGLPIADTGYHLSVGLTRNSRKLLQTMDIVHVHQPFISGSFGLYCAANYKLPLVFTNHTRYDLYVKAYLPLLPAAVSESALQTFFHHFSRQCAALIAPSQSIAGLMKRWRVEGRVVVIPNGIDLARFQSVEGPEAPRITRDVLKIPDAAVVAVYVGRMSPEKSLDRLLRLFARVVMRAEGLGRLVHLLMVGDGSELESLQHLARQMKLERHITFAGAVAYEQVPAYLMLADFFVSASVSEVHPLTFIEAAAAGLPALGIESTGVVDIVQDGVTGLIAADRNEEFVACFTRLVAQDGLRQRLGHGARIHSMEYSAATNARRILELYTELCGEAERQSHTGLGAAGVNAAAASRSTSGK